MTNIRKIATVTALLLSSIALHAQKTIKLYYNTNDNSFIRGTPLNGLSVALNKTKNKNKYVEYELGTVLSNTTNLMAKDTAGNAIIQGVSGVQAMSLRYERGRTLMNTTLKGRDWKFALGHSAQLNVINDRYTSYNTSIYSLEQKNVYVAYHIIPRINVSISKRLGIDFNTPFKLFKLGYLQQSIDNPTIPVAQRSWSNFNFDLFNSSNTPITARIGIVYKL